MVGKNGLKQLGRIALVVFLLCCVVIGIVRSVRSMGTEWEKESARQTEWIKSEPADRAEFEKDFGLSADRPNDPDAARDRHAKVISKLRGWADALLARQQQMKMVPADDYESQIEKRGILRSEIRIQSKQFIEDVRLADRFDKTPIDHRDGIFYQTGKQARVIKDGEKISWSLVVRILNEPHF